LRPQREDRGLRAIAHHAAAPCRAGHIARLAPAQRGQRQRILRTRRVGQRREAVEKATSRAGSVVAMLGLRSAAWRICVSSGKPGQAGDETGIGIEPRAIGAIQLPPAGDGRGNRAGLGREHLDARVPFGAILTLGGGGDAHQNAQRQRRNPAAIAVSGRAGQDRDSGGLDMWGLGSLSGDKINGTAGGRWVQVGWPPAGMRHNQDKVHVFRFDLAW
jgi:hypothetical protein